MDWPANLVLILLLAASLYTLIPDLLLHRLGVGTWKRHYAPGVVLSFDDGPDPAITPPLLAILEKLEIKAVFFVIGEKAQKHPELIRLIQSKGHQLGAHCQHHRHAWLLSPWKTWREWDDCICTLERLCGERIELIRPPWAFFSLATCTWMLVRKKRAVLYNVEGHDWQLKQNPEEITRRILKSVQEGSIILLHDSGGEKGAPEKMLKSLGGICQQIKETKKLALIPLCFPKWTIWRRLIYTIWEKWERIFARIYNIERISATNILRVSRTHYKGPELYTSQGQLLATRGDIVGEIHLTNSRLARSENNSLKTGVQVLKQARESLPELAKYIEGNPAYQEIKVLTGLSIINQGVKGLGFQVQDVRPTLFNKMVNMLQHLIYRVYNPTGKLDSKKQNDHPQLVWISKSQLIERWLPKQAV
ncbi:MAG: polysaccharide deacetylase family protein [Syntrophomonas sp.]